MTLSALLLLGILATVAWRSRRCWLARGLAAGIVVVFLAISCGPLTDLLLVNLQNGFAMAPPIQWAPRNAIVLLSAGSSRLAEDEPLAPSVFANGRILQAAVIYRTCRASGQQCMVLVSGGDSQQHGIAEATVYAGILVTLGIPASDVQTETRSLNTFENARYSRPLLAIYDPQRLILLTSGIHLRRSLLMFEHFGMQPLAVAGDVLRSSSSIWPLASNIELFDAALHEYVGIWQYRVYNLLGINTPRIAGRIIP